MMADIADNRFAHIHFARDELPFDRWEASDETTRAAIVAGEHGGIAVVYVCCSGSISINPVIRRFTLMAQSGLSRGNLSQFATRWLPVTLYTLHTRLIYAEAIHLIPAMSALHAADRASRVEVQ